MRRFLIFIQSQTRIANGDHVLPEEDWIGIFLSTSGTSFVLNEEWFGLQIEASQKQDLPMVAMFSSDPSYLWKTNNYTARAITLSNTR